MEKKNVHVVMCEFVTHHISYFTPQSLWFKMSLNSQRFTLISLVVKTLCCLHKAMAAMSEVTQQCYLKIGDTVLLYT